MAEFYPDDAGLLGRNVGPGETVFLRLRFCNNDAIFLPMEIILSTMLHELAHMVYGPHNNNFYNLCSQLKDKYVQLIHMGYASEIYSSTRHNTGNGRIIEHEAQNYPTLPAQSGQRFGIGQGQDIRKVIADTATKRFKKNEDRYDPASKKNPAGSRRLLAWRLAALTASKEGPWLCEICTSINPANYLYCDACGIERFSGVD